ncbi:GNAT family N-acetyltransferase [uncultured Hoeflea sp.]|uniref:GNAT family N-acetyltransferase n=1 Tax=uncultured Hoeflea sp. TaxID=538666 RepID=UPI00262A768D|nr:GNAT family N-acetyltransferase [uncultured Hoeflea sp.]
MSSTESAPADSGRIGFRAVTANDYTLLEDWMRQPHWRQWWGEVETELGYIRDMVEGRDSTRPFLFLRDGEPMGYIQAWRIRDHLVEPWISKAPWMLKVPTGSVGVDLSVGLEENLGRGLGSAALKAFVKMLIAEGCRDIIIDPDAANARAIRAYEKAGFEALFEAPDPEARDQAMLIMRLRLDQDS